VLVAIGHKCACCYILAERCHVVDEKGPGKEDIIRQRKRSLWLHTYIPYCLSKGDLI